MKHIVAVVFLAFLSVPSFSQSKQETGNLLKAINTAINSKSISKLKPAKKLISQGRILLPLLAEFFSDTSSSLIKSDCQNRFLTHGEVAIIIADKIEIMPYYKITGIQNCTFEICPGNPNGIEYYLWAIKRDGANVFVQKYNAWLNSEDRKQWPPYVVSQPK